MIVRASGSGSMFPSDQARAVVPAGEATGVPTGAMDTSEPHGSESASTQLPVP